MPDDQVILCHCPRCKKCYRQTVRSVEGIKKRLLRNWEVETRARARAMGQQGGWNGFVYVMACAACHAACAPSWARGKLGDAELQGESQ